MVVSACINQVIAKVLIFCLISVYGCIVLTLSCVCVFGRFSVGSFLYGNRFSYVVFSAVHVPCVDSLRAYLIGVAVSCLRPSNNYVATIIYYY